jgi:hypothetical protein
VPSPDPACPSCKLLQSRTNAIVAIPDVYTLLALEPEELSGNILLLLRKPRSGGAGYLLAKLISDLRPVSYLANQVTPYPPEKKAEVNQAVSEAWAWLEAQGLLIPAPDIQNGWGLLSRRARKIATEAEFADYKNARLFPKEVLHPRIADRVWGAFMRGEYDGAMFQAMKAVEVALREASGLGADLVGVKLMRPASLPENGPLTDLKCRGLRKGRTDGAFHGRHRFIQESAIAPRCKSGRPVGGTGNDLFC